MPESSMPSPVDVVTQLVTGPSLREVASKTLQPALKTLYPTLHIDPQQAMVVTPTWVIKGEQVAPGREQIESLTDVLVRLALSGTTVTYLDGEHFLTLHPGRSAIQLPVKIDAVGRLLNEFAPLMFVAFKEQHIAYWGTFIAPDRARWQQMSDALRNLWNVDARPGWDADQQAMAHAVFNAPDKQQRLPDDKYKTRACLIDLDQGEADAEEGKHLTLLDCAVLIGTVGQRTMILTYSVIHGFQTFDSLDELGEALPRKFWQKKSGSRLKWRLVEPQGNFFDHQACTLIALEGDALGEINFFEGSTFDQLYPHTGKPRQPPPNLKPHIDRMRAMLPSWLDEAAPADQAAYSRYLLDLTVLQHSNKGKSFQEQIASLQTFTRDALSRQMLKDHPTATGLKIDNIEISIASLEVWGTFVLPGNIQIKSLSLIELALQNLAGLPLGNKTVRYKDDSALPDWMTVTYLEQLVSTVDIGKTYPAHLKKLLVDDAVQAAALQQLYTRQLAIELPLLALQHKVRGEAGIDELGYRYVVAALDSHAEARQVNGQEIVIRPLAFAAHRASSGADTVTNMFVIGPRDADKGPCVLYRPLFQMALIQYPSHANLLYAIQHSRQLRESVLAWLPDDVRFNYSQFVFTAKLPSVWTVPQLLVNPLTALDMSGPVTLGAAVIESDILATLHTTNVQAVITQADRQSVSNAEARWASLKRGGWMLFNAALPFLGRSVGTAAWIWQIMDDLQEIGDVANQESGKVAWKAVADIFLALGMVLAHRAAVGDRPPPESTYVFPEEEPQATTPHPTLIKPQHLPDVTGAELPTAHESSVNALAALLRSPLALTTLLDSFNIAKPAGLGDAASTGQHQHLYAHQNKWYAPVGKRWFEVQINDNADVQIVDSRHQSSLAGPLLTHTAGGQWVVDLRLRLRGGGLRNRRQEAKSKSEKLAKKIATDLEAFDLTMDDKQSQLDQAHSAMASAQPQTSATARQEYLDTLDSQGKAYEANIKQIKALNLVQNIPNYRTTMIQRLEMQLFLGQEWLSQHSTDYQANVRAAMEMIADDANVERQTFIQTCERMTDQTQAIIEKVESAHSRFQELELLGKDAVQTLVLYRKALPTYDLNDLKLLQISLGQEICLKPGKTTTHAEAQQTLETLIEDAALNIQSSLHLTADEGLSNLRERIEALSNVSEQFTAVDQRFADFAAEFTDQLQTDRLGLVRSRVIEFKALTDVRLADLLRNRHLLEPQPGPSRPTSGSTSTRKIIKTRFKGTLVGERKKSIDGQDTDLVEVRSELTGVIATFHEKSPGEWVEHVPTKQPPTKARPTLKKSIEHGQALIDGLAEFHRRIEARIKRGQRLAVEIEEQYHNHAALLRKASSAIDEALTANNLTADSSPGTEVLGHALNNAATHLYEKGTSTRIRMIKHQPPAAAGVAWLKEKNEVKIAKTVTRRMLKRHTNDFLDEYEVRDARTGKVLCYAHFHYISANVPDVSFEAGHMKTVAQRRLGGAYDLRGLTNQQVIEIHRSEILSSQLAETVFFTPARPVVTESAPL
ncbi:hypothetical protein PSH79_27640 [Pseudomonas sp. FP2196]|uniref:dermonecrotic toxin domain-containing protein n=1 Tax=Pseudomonas sp. FP2196 TaxID=2954086 RepID=UPI0027335D65|nr:DUF6543 domain-containing protein [Pseudomonas sp. FP2196]WLH35630.1 hypothetical protein PSH79_27640 [Pseudomonas sp. FP2196]